MNENKSIYDVIKELDNFIINDYVAIAPKQKFKKSPAFNPKKQKAEFFIYECLSSFRTLCEKQIGDIYLTGSVSLYLQGKITRCTFKDIDIIVAGEYSLDDDILDNPTWRDYPQDPNGAERKPLLFNGIKIDLFYNVEKVNFIEVEYHGNTYLCQDYKDIIKAKLNMVLPKVKDLDELLGKSFEITYK